MKTASKQFINWLRQWLMEFWPNEELLETVHAHFFEGDHSFIGF